MPSGQCPDKHSCGEGLERPGGGGECRARHPPPNPECARDSSKCLTLLATFDLCFILTGPEHASEIFTE
jgi:hypothetical protein